MQVHIVHYAEGAARARGLAVVIDVFRAFSAACYAFHRGARRIIATHSLDIARQIKKQNPHYLLMGERHAQKPSDFDFGNSPSELAEADLSGATLVHTTHAGTRALLAANQAEEAITGSFVNAAAIARYIRNLSPASVYLVCSGFEGQKEAAEDLLCAQYIRDLLLEREPDYSRIADKLQTAPSAVRFFDPADPASPESDFYLCLHLDCFPTVLRRTHTNTDYCLLEPVTLNPPSPTD